MFPWAIVRSWGRGLRLLMIVVAWTLCLLCEIDVIRRFPVCGV